MNISVIGTGYVGLVSGTCFADSGNKVLCVDNNQEKLKKLKNGEVPIYEPGLEHMFERCIKEDRLHFTDDLKKAVDFGDIIFMCLPTPPGADGQADLSAVLSVAGQIGSMIDEYKVIVNKSTVPVGTGDRVEKAMLENCDADLFDVVSNPEFLREGAAVDDFMKPERVVIGTNSQRAAELMERLYEPFVRSGNPIITMDRRSSELTKYAANSFLATKISFMNEIANLCEKVGANVDNVRRGIGTDTRIGKRFLFAGIGYGGSCFPKDVQALDYTANENDYNFSVLKAVMGVNERQKTSLVDKMNLYYKGVLKGKSFGVWGLSFKPETDDVREAPAIYIIQKLIDAGASVKAYDPEAIETFKVGVGKTYVDKITFVDSQEKASNEVDSLIICTDWNEFRRPDFTKLKERLKSPVIFDGRNLYSLEEMKKQNITYISVGREVIYAD